MSRAALLGDELTEAIDAYAKEPTAENLSNFSAALVGRCSSMAAALPFAVGIIGQLQQSRENTDKIEQVDGKVDGVHRIVNSRMDEFKQALVDVAALKEQQAGVLAELTAAKAELTIANERARGIAIGREQAIAEVAPTGSTPPRGTAKSG